MPKKATTQGLAPSIFTQFVMKSHYYLISNWRVSQESPLRMNQQYKEKYTTSIKRNALVSYTSLFDEKELVVAFREREIFIFMFLRRVSTSYFCNASTVFC